MKDTMDTKDIRIEVKEYYDLGHTYFLATSPDVDGFMVEGHTLEEVFELVPVVLHDFLEVVKEQAEERKEKHEKMNALCTSKNILMQYKYEKLLPLELA